MSNCCAARPACRRRSTSGRGPARLPMSVTCLMLPARPRHRHLVAVDQHDARFRLGVAQHHARRPLDRDACRARRAACQQRRGRRLGEARGQRLHRGVRFLAARVQLVERVVGGGASARGRGRRDEQHARRRSRPLAVARIARRGRWNAHRSNGNVRRVQRSGARLGHRRRLGVRHVARGVSRRAARGPQRHRAAHRLRHHRLPHDARGARSTGFEPAPWVAADEAAADGSHRRLRASPRRSSRSTTRGARSPPDGDDRAGVVLGHLDGRRPVDAAVSRRASFAAVRPARRRCSSTARSRIRRPASPAWSIKLRGPNMTVSHKEASGLAAIVARRRSAPRRARAGADRRRRRRHLRDLLQGARSLRA